MIRYIVFIKLSLSFLLILTLVLSTENTYAQKKDRKKKANTSQEKKELSEEKTTELDHYFLEGEKYFILKDLAKSKTYFERVLELDSYHAATNYKLAQIYNLNQQSDVALGYAKQAKELDSSNKFYYTELANIQTSLGELEQAEATYSELVQKVPGTELYLFELAALQIYQKKYEDAIYSYELAQFHLGPMEEISLQKQQVYLKQNKLDLAIKEGYELIKLNPTEETYVMTLGRIMVSNDKLDEAEKFLNEQVVLNNKNEKLYILLSEVYRKKGNNVLALESLKIPFASQTVDLNAKIRTLAGYLGMLPNTDLQQPLVELSEILVTAHPDSYQALAMTGDMYYNTGEKEKARNYYLTAVKIDGSSFNIWQNILTLDMEMEDYQGAIDHSETAMETFPNQTSLYYFNGTAFLIQKKYEEAIKSFNRGKAFAARDDNMNSLFYGQIGDAYNSMGNHAKSDEAYEQALKAKPDNDHVLNNYSYFLSLRKTDLEKAKSMSLKLVQDYPQSPTYLDTHAWVLYMMEDFEGAVKYLKEAAKYDPSAVIIEHYGDALFQLGEINEAVEQWKRARDLVEDTSTLDKKITDRQLYE